MPLSTRSDVVSLDPDELQEIVTVVRLIEYFQFATVALLVYDTIITFDKEAKYFWVSIKLPRRPVNFVYFINRYIGIFGAVAPIFLSSLAATLPLSGKFWQWAMDIANWTIIISIDYILMIRVLALYSQGRTPSICLKTLLALEAVFMLGILIYFDIIWNRRIDVFAISADISICAYFGSPTWQLGMIPWLITSIYGTLLMILALYKAAEYWRMSSGFKGFTLVKILVQDQIVYFVLAITCSVIAILNFRLVLSNLFIVAILNQLGNPAYLSLLGSRMLFNLKGAGERGQNEGISYRIPSRMMSDMDFADPVNPQRESVTEHRVCEQPETA